MELGDVQKVKMRNIDRLQKRSIFCLFGGIALRAMIRAAECQWYFGFTLEALMKCAIFG